ncbi:hypothetical protein [Azospirillum brasilense]|uniref:hypothetical protein n=1 Tax=Azospirillum brasilense TaxID=192 RepID=UPI0020000A94|nr:hypothetical protein [Azospirillum brasilense]
MPHFITEPSLPAATLADDGPAALTSPAPLPMLLFCPRCGLQHIDAPDERAGWTYSPHRSHLCADCGCIWRPADVPTSGVLAIATSGKADNWNGADAVAAAEAELLRTFKDIMTLAGAAREDAAQLPGVTDMLIGKVAGLSRAASIIAAAMDDPAECSIQVGAFREASMHPGALDPLQVVEQVGQIVGVLDAERGHLPVPDAGDVAGRGVDDHPAISGGVGGDVVDRVHKPRLVLVGGPRHCEEGVNRSATGQAPLTA